MRAAAAVVIVGVIFLATTVLAGTAAAAPAPAPGELWSRFPLEPSDEPTPAAVPAQAPAQREDSARPAASNEESSPQWVLLGFGAAAAAAAAALAYSRGRSTAVEPVTVIPNPDPDSYPYRPGRLLAPVSGEQAEKEESGKPAVIRSAVRTAPAAARVHRSLAVEAPTRLAPPRADQSLIDALSPRLDERVEEVEAEKEASTTQVGEIQWWRGYFKSQFYVKADPPLDRLLESRAFRARGSDAPEPSDGAVAAHEALAEELVAAGWEREGRGAHWFSDRFRRPGP